MSWSPCLIRSVSPAGRLRVQLGHRVVDDYLEFLAARCRYCDRPTQLDCQYESICETCAYYTTNPSFNPTLQAQKDHAAQRDQHQRVDLFQMLIDRNQKTAT